MALSRGRALRQDKQEQVLGALPTGRTRQVAGSWTQGFPTTQHLPSSITASAESAATHTVTSGKGVCMTTASSPS